MYKDWDKVEEAKEFEMLPSGGYVCQILRVEDVPDKEYLKIEFDIAEGEHKDYFVNACAGRDFWTGAVHQILQAKGASVFKGMLKAIEESNPDFKADSFGDEKELIGKRVGLTIGHEKYWNSSGDEKTRLYVDQVRSVKAIENKKFKVPADREDDYNKPKENPMDGFKDVYVDDEVPF